MPRKKRSEVIVSEMEALALVLMGKAKEEATNIDLKMDIFSQIREWVKVKSKLEDDDGGAIAEYKRRLAGEDTEDKPKRRAYGGARLEAIKSGLPTDRAGHDDGDSQSSGGEGSAAA